MEYNMNKEEVIAGYKSSMGYALWLLECAVEDAYKQGFAQGQVAAINETHRDLAEAYDRGFNDAMFGGKAKT